MGRDDFIVGGQLVKPRVTSRPYYGTAAERAAAKKERDRKKQEQIDRYAVQRDKDAAQRLANKNRFAQQRADKAAAALEASAEANAAEAADRAKRLEATTPPSDPVNYYQKAAPKQAPVTVTPTVAPKKTVPYTESQSASTINITKPKRRKPNQSNLLSPSLARRTGRLKRVSSNYVA